MVKFYSEGGLMYNPLLPKFPYPQDFVERVKAKFPGDTEIVALVQHGAVFSVEKFLREHDPALFQEQQTLWSNRKAA